MCTFIIIKVQVYILKKFTLKIFGKDPLRFLNKKALRKAVSKQSSAREASGKKPWQHLPVISHVNIWLHK